MTLRRMDLHAGTRKTGELPGSLMSLRTNSSSSGWPLTWPFSWPFSKDKKGYEARNNHASPSACNTRFFEWYQSTFPNPHDAPYVLDVGGGNGDLHWGVDDWAGFS